MSAIIRRGVPSTTWAHFSSFLPVQINLFGPILAKCFADSRPIPVVDPTITTVRPERSARVGGLLTWIGIFAEAVTDGKNEAEDVEKNLSQAPFVTLCNVDIKG